MQPGGSPPPGAGVSLVDHACATGDDTPNPDASRYLVAQLQDANGAPIGHRTVNFTWFDAPGTSAETITTFADQDGVATLIDTQSVPLPSAGDHVGVIAVDGGANAPALFTACNNVRVPGTLNLSLADPDLVMARIDLHEAGTPASDFLAEFGYAYGGRERFDSSIAMVGTDEVRVLRGTYTLNVVTVLRDHGYLVYQPVAIDGDTVIDLDLASTPTFHVTRAARDGRGDPVPGGGMMLARADPGTEQLIAFGFSTPDGYVSAGEYRVQPYLSVPDPGGGTWTLRFDGAPRTFSPNGASGTLAYGGPLDASARMEEGVYHPGDTATLALTVVDPHGFRLLDVTAPSTAAAAGSNTVTANLIDAHGAIVSTVTQSDATSVSFDLPPDTAPGTYTVDVTLALGPYQDSDLAVTAGFQVPQ